MLPGSTLADVADERLPLHLEPMVGGRRAGHFLPLLVEVHGLRHIGIPHRTRRVDAALAEAAREAGDGRAVRTVGMERDEVVALDPRAPARIDLCDHPA